jgi:S1-C subfamily serine protease
VGNDAGFGVVNGMGDVGSLALTKDGVVGIATQIGRDSDYGFIRVVLWKDIKNMLNRAMKSREKSLYLGISVVAARERNGISIVRVTADSPLTHHLKMGDTITKVNGHTVRNPEDLTRIIMLSEKRVVMEIEDPNKTKK